MGDAKPPPTEPEVELLDWADPDAVKAWAVDVWTQVEDAIAAGLDATAPRRKRVLSHAEARRKLREACGALRAAHAFAGLADDAGASADAPIPAGRYWPVVFAAMAMAARRRSTRLAESVAMLVHAHSKHVHARAGTRGS